LENKVTSINDQSGNTRYNHDQLINTMCLDYDNKSASNNYTTVCRLNDINTNTFDMDLNLNSNIKSSNTRIYNTEKFNN
jgi:hypothetical protein